MSAGAPTTSLDDGARNYLTVALAALLVIGFALVGGAGGNLVALVALAPALAALAFRAPFLPAVFLGMLVLFALYPDGNVGASLSERRVRPSHFRLTDLFLVAAVVSYFAAYFRLASYKARVLPGNQLDASAGKPPPAVRREGVVATGEEFARLAAQILGVTAFAAVAWWLLTAVRVEPLEVPPLRFDPTRDNESSRFLVLMGAVGFASLALGSAFWYWGLTRMPPSVARQFLTDTRWRENRRELNRLEKWRAWRRGNLARPEPLRLSVRPLLRILMYGVIAVLFLTCAGIVVTNLVALFPPSKK